MGKMAKAPGTIPNHEVTLRTEASAKKAAERKEMMPSRTLGHKDDTRQTNQNHLVSK